MDLDLNLHMNNGRYLSIMDLGRFDLLLRAGVFWNLTFKGYYPVVASESIRFKKSLDPFQKFKIITFIESWDEKSFYIKQTFLYQNNLVAEGYIKGKFKQRGRKGTVPTAEIFHLVGMPFEGARVSRLAESQNQIEEILIK